jgi:hypothetical protein
MKTKHFLSFIALCAFTFLISEGLLAAKWRVNNLPQMYADFTNLQTAINTVAAGDTLIVEGSAGGYGDITISKPLVLLGPGFLLTENDSTQAFKNTAQLNSATIQSASNGTILSGFYFTARINVDCNNVKIKNNYLYYNSYQPMIEIYNNRNNITISGNYFIRNYASNNNFIELGSNTSSINIFNNYFTSPSYSGAYLIYMNDAASANIYNNIFNKGYVQLRNAIFRNNILSEVGHFNISNVVVENNICSSTQIGNQNGNQININMESVFVCWSDCSGFSPDERYRLKAGSPAINAGYGGVDCGIFDGPFPYSISGLAEIPAIWDIIQNGNQFTIKAKSH